jgi:hypothetical protein
MTIVAGMQQDFEMTRTRKQDLGWPIRSDARSLVDHKFWLLAAFRSVLLLSGAGTAAGILPEGSAG